MVIRFGSVPTLLLLGLLLGAGGCKRGNSRDDTQTPAPAPRGERIGSANSTNVPSTNSASRVIPADYSRPDPMRHGVIQLGWEKLSGFKFDVYEVASETNLGRALLRSDDKIPLPMTKYDGREVEIVGFVLPLRLKQGKVTEFLLLRDQGACCFGPQAQINHFLRVKFPGGFRHEGTMPWRATGILKVGEIYVQGYLTGIYQMDARRVEPVGADQ